MKCHHYLELSDFRYLIYSVSNICKLLYLLNHLVTTVESVHNRNKCKLPKQASTILFKSSTNNNALFNSTFCTCNVSSGATLMLAHRKPAWYVSLYPFDRISISHMLLLNYCGNHETLDNIAGDWHWLSWNIQCTLHILFNVLKFGINVFQFSLIFIESRLLNL